MASASSPFELWVRQTVANMPYFDSAKGGFVGTQALKKTLLASVPQNIAETTQQAKLPAELNTIFKQGGLTQELLAECERRRQLLAAEKEGKEEGSTDGKDEKKVLEGKAIPAVGRTAVVGEASSSTTTVEKPDGTVGLDIKKSSTPGPMHSEGVKLDIVDKEQSQEKESGAPVPKDQTPKKKLEVSLGSPGSSSTSSKTPKSPTSPHVHDTTIEPASPTTLIHTPPFLLAAPQLPFLVQHHLLNYLQTLLEGACFSYMLREFPEVLKEKEWTCPELAELTVWVHTISKSLANSGRLDERDLAEVCSLLRRAGKLRHCAVHRKAVSTVQLWIHLDSAEATLRFFADGERIKEVVSLKDLVESQARELGFTLDRSDKQLSDELDELNRLREELTRREMAARAKQEELEIKAKSDMAENLAGLLEQAINKRTISFASTASTPTRVGTESPTTTTTTTTTESPTRPTTVKKAHHTVSVEEFKKYGLKPLRPSPTSTGQFSLTKVAASARKEMARKANAAQLGNSLRNSGCYDRSSEAGNTTDSSYWDASETLARKAVLEDDPGYSSEEGGGTYLSSTC